MTPILSRIAVVVCGFAALAVSNWYLATQTTPTEQLAEGFLGQKWYRIALGPDHIGYMHNHTYRDASGHWYFDATTHFLLATSEPVNLFKQLVFDARPPHRLKSAKYTSHRDGNESSTTVAVADAGYRASITRGDVANEIDLDWSFGLSDYLSVELWLDSEAPPAAAETTARSLDFERLKVTTRTYRIGELNREGYLIENAAPLAATRTQLNHDYHPTALSMAGIFDVSESSREAALSLSKLRRKTSYLIPLDQRIVNHTDLKRLRLKLHQGRNGGSRQHQLPQEFTLEHSPVTSTGDTARFIGESLPYPISHPTIQAMAQSALTADGAEQVTNLVNLTNAQLEYSENRPAGSVLRALEQGRGECTDYADLFTTLARAIGLPARTVFGLAYKDGSNPAFVFHAWNEVFSDDRWQSVDPTWNQTRVDATHIPLTDEQAAAMLLASAARSVALSVLDTQYF
jgi:hypothetical protein